MFAALGGVALLVVLAVVAVATLADDVGEPVAQPATPSSTLPTVIATVPDATTTVQPTAPVDEIGTAHVEAGECVELLVATEEQAEVTPVDCAAPQASHIVVAQVADKVDCPGDADVTYYETSLDVETLALCMDVNWQIGTCYDITEGPAGTDRVSCSAQPGREIAQVESVQQDTTVSDGCSEGGFAYDERQFVVCTVTVE